MTSGCYRFTYALIDLPSKPSKPLRCPIFTGVHQSIDHMLKYSQLHSLHGEVGCSVVSPRGRLGPRQGWLSSVTFFECHGDSLGTMSSATTGEGNVVSGAAWLRKLRPERGGYAPVFGNKAYIYFDVFSYTLRS